MNIISLEDALLLFKKWQDEETPLQLLFTAASSAINLGSAFCTVRLPGGRIVEASRNLLRFAFPIEDEAEVRIFLAAAHFIYAESREMTPLPLEPLGLSQQPTFDECVRLEWPNSSQIFLFAGLVIK